jgi:hypothetical protein
MRKYIADATQPETGPLGKGQTAHMAGGLAASPPGVAILPHLW